MPWISCTHQQGLDKRTIYINTDHVFRFEATEEGKTKFQMVG
jgi:hypothetical protein